MNYGVVARGSAEAQIVANRRGVTTLDHRPNLAGDWIYVETGDPEFDTDQSPPWLNDFYFLSPVAFRHGLDGQTDMIGVYDLSLGAVSGDIAFMMPVRWASQAPALHMFAVVLTAEADPADDIITVACQRIDPNDPDATVGAVPVRIYWPLCADLCVT